MPLPYGLNTFRPPNLTPPSHPVLVIGAGLALHKHSLANERSQLVIVLGQRNPNTCLYEKLDCITLSCLFCDPSSPKFVSDSHKLPVAGGSLRQSASFLWSFCLTPQLFSPPLQSKQTSSTSFCTCSYVPLVLAF